jgi:DNA invertase Pin-like site-specific DNA recombinase
MYLRKSRADMEAEARGEGETLAKHKKYLLEIAKRMNLSISKIYNELVSGERIYDRPQVQKLLQEVSDGQWDAVMVMEVDRLARGDTVDQGMIAQAFKESNTKIITPQKTYDPNNEFDEEYFEFGLFMSRREYKVITRRLQRGRIGSVKEGNYIGTRPPYGYEIYHDDKGRTLRPHPDQAQAVKLIFEWYANGRMGSNKIANELNRLPFKN